ncbi:hypothetical protein YC2023_038851 [Brassica napus]
MEVQAETQPGSSIKYSSSESSSYVHPTSLILHRELNLYREELNHGQMGYTISKGIDLASAKRLLLVSNFYNANIAFVLARLQSNNSVLASTSVLFQIMYFVMVEKSGAEDGFPCYVSAEILAIVPDPGAMVATRPVKEQY